MLLGNKQGFVFYAAVWQSTQRSSGKLNENRKLTFPRDELRTKTTPLPPHPQKKKERKKEEVCQDREIQGKRLLFL